MINWTIKGHLLEYEPKNHLYLVDGIVVPSVTQILKVKFGHKYDGIPEEILNRASVKGTAVHDAIEKYCKEGIESDLLELHNFKFLQTVYGFEVVDNEVPVIVFIDGKPVCAGRLDLVLKDGDNFMLGDIKRTSKLDKEYLAYQLNIYRIGYQQCYDVPISALKGLHLRENVRKYINIPINEKMSIQALKEALNELEVNDVSI